MSLRRIASLARVVLLALLATACPGDGPGPTPTGIASPSVSDLPAPGGEIRVAYPYEPPTLNPFLRTGDAPAVRELVRPLLPPLYLLADGDAKPQPWLADEVLEDSPGRVRLRLRDDAVWSDGRPITAADVLFTWRTIMDRRWPVASRVPYDALRDVVAESSTVVRFEFARPVGEWRDLFSAGLGVLPRHALEGKDFAKALKDSWPVSGGPYVLVRYTRGLEMVFEATPHPWRVRAKIQRIRVQFVPDSTTALQLAAAGKVDVVGPYSAGDFSRRLGETAGFNAAVDAGRVWSGLVIDTGAGVLADARVRRALALSVDRDAILTGLVRGEGEPLHRPFLDPPAAAATVGAADPAAAARLLDEAGFTARRAGVRRKGATELSVSIVFVESDDLAYRITRAVYGHLRAAGFAVDLVSVEYEALWRDFLPAARLEVALVTFADPPGGILRARYRSGQSPPAGVNYARIADPGLDAAVDAADPGADATADAAEAGRVVEALAAAMPVVPLYRAKVAAGASRRVSGVRPNASADGFLAQAHEWRLAA